MDAFLAAAAALAAPVGVGFLFAFAIRALMNADRTERMAMARMEAEERARAGRAAGDTVTRDPTASSAADRDDAAPV